MMKRNKLTEAQIFAMLNEAEAGVPITELCRKYQLGNSTFYKIKSKYAGMSLSDLSRLKALIWQHFTGQII